MSYIRAYWKKYPDRKRLYLLVAMAAVTLFRLWMTAAQPIAFLPGQEDDDTVFLAHAASIIRGHWLGVYTQNTLVKGAFYSLFVAGVHFTGIPLLLAQQLLYVFACVIFIVAIRKLIPRRAILAVSYCVVLFNPGSYTATATARVIRDFTCASFAFLAVSSMVAIYARVGERYTAWKPWAVLLGLSLAATLLTREDSAWVLPLIVVASLLCAVMTFFKLRGKPRVKSLAVLVLPFVLVGVCSAVIAGANAYAYGKFVTNEYADANFINAYSALCRIDGGKWMPNVPVTKAARQAAYAVSPAFRELEPYLEGQKMAIFVNADDQETHGTFFTWNLRNAVAEAKSGVPASGREGMALAQYVAGMGFSNVGLGINHSMAHTLSAHYDTPHGVACAMLLPIAMEFNKPVVADRLADVARAMGVDTAGMSTEEAADAAIAAVRQLSEDVEIPKTCAGLVEGDLEQLACDAMADACFPGNPREADHDQVVELFRKIMA